MAILTPAPFRDLVTRLYREPVTQDALFELPRRHWYMPDARSLDMSVLFHGTPAGNPSGPAAGPHTQMAQNLLLSYVAGGRILELKTVQANDRLEIARPCIDMTNVGYNIEWSQELRVEESLGEYVAGAMLIELFKNEQALTQGSLDGAAGDYILDISVGYDLAGIRSDKVRRFLEGMRDAGSIVDRLRADIPREFKDARETNFRTRLSDSVTLSTFHGCPADEIERICEHLIADHDLDVTVKMNPPTLGRDRLEHLLYDVMGYTALRVCANAYTNAIGFDESVELCARLTAFAGQRGRRVGFKFSNTLEVENNRDFFSSDERTMYLSGQPLHVITMTLTDVFRQAVGPDVPISFSAGVDMRNFPLMVACGFVPITMSTDLLRPRGYGRLPGYLSALADRMRECGASNIDEFIRRRFDKAAQAPDHAATPATGAAAATATGAAATTATGASEATDERRDATRQAGLLNTTIVADMARGDTRYHADQNARTPKRIDSHLTVFDCLTCDKCLPVCPNAANFTYPTPKSAFEFHDILITPDGRWRDGECRRFEIDRGMQIACLADFCNECGNCDTFCPEYGGPYIEKPSFFGSVQSWTRCAPRDGFVVGRCDDGGWIRGRIKQREYELIEAVGESRCHFIDEFVDASIDMADHRLTGVVLRQPIDGEHRLDMWVFHTMRHLYKGVLDPSRVNQINAAFR